eukprot:1136186-Pelagomonas_calceolata.AAC.4
MAPPYLFDTSIPDQARLNSSRPDAILVTPCPTNPNRPPTSPSHRIFCSMRGNEEARSSTNPARQFHELNIQNCHIHLLGIKYCERYKACQWCSDRSLAATTLWTGQTTSRCREHSSHNSPECGWDDLYCPYPGSTFKNVVTLPYLHTNLLGLGKVIYAPHTMEPLKELSLDAHTAVKLALKLHAHFVQYAYKFISTRRAFKNTTFISHHRDQARATASNPPDPH